jgi:hypothetical protein
MQKPFKKCDFIWGLTDFYISEKNLSGVFKKNGSLMIFAETLEIPKIIILDFWDCLPKTLNRMLIGMLARAYLQTDQLIAILDSLWIQTHEINLLNASLQKDGWLQIQNCNESMISWSQL